jgi:hypothetical protein
VLAAPEINFHALIKGAAGKDGARTPFERLITQLVKLDHGAARRVEANPGDWGLDIIVGDFGEGGSWSGKPSKHGLVRVLRLR